MKSVAQMIQAQDQNVDTPARVTFFKQYCDGREFSIKVA